jgi:serine/threonine protein kinase
MFRIVEDEMPPIPPDCSELLRDFLSQCFNKDPSKRPSAEMLFEHRWLEKYWSAFQDLRPQDSIPFLRRVSADVQKSEAARYLDIIESPTSEQFHGTEEGIGGSPQKRRFSNGPGHRGTTESEPVSPREHTFVRTTFSKPMVCRVCLLNTKKSAVLCDQCSLIAHSKCAVNAPPTCGLRAQLLLFAQYAEKGNPHSAYGNPLDALTDTQLANIPLSPASEVPYVTHTPRSSFDGPPPRTPITPTSPSHPPTAFKFANPFKRSRPLSVEPGRTSTSSKPPTPIPPPKDVKPRGNKLKRQPHPKDQRESVTSNSTSLNTSSLRSTAAVTENSSTGRGGARSVVSAASTRLSNGRLGDVDADASPPEASLDVDMPIPGNLPPDTKRREHESKSSCALQ